MSHIYQLIEEMCPNGVDYRALGEVGTVVRGKRFVKDDMIDSGVPCIHYGEIYTKYGIAASKSYSFVSQERARTLRFAQPGDVIMASAGETVEDIGKSVAWLGDEPIAIHDACYAFSSSMDSKFASYFFASRGFRDQIRQQISSSKISSISTQNVARARIPVPPLKVQQEIVRILDQFTQLEAELEAELEARRRQYEHYRALILKPTPEWQETTIGDLAEVFDGPHATPKKTAEGPWYLSISSLKDGNFDFALSAHLSNVDLPKWTKRVAPQPGDTLFSYETRLGQAAYWQLDEPAALGRRMGLLRPQVDKVRPKFLTIAYLSPQFQSVIATRTVRGSTVDRIPIANLGSWPISIPSLPEQDRIIGLLEKFDLLVNDLSVGLPAELAARRKQYEYYRDKLLTFDEVTA